jgi:hypothetical protein
MSPGQNHFCAPRQFTVFQINSVPITFKGKEMADNCFRRSCSARWDAPNDGGVDSAFS